MALPSLAALAPTGASDSAPAAKRSAPAAAPDAMKLSELPADVLEKVLLFLKDPCEVRFDHICSTSSSFREVCERDSFWYTLCEREGWHREDRWNGWHTMTNFTWRKQFFKWCKLRFGPYSEEEWRLKFPNGVDHEQTKRRLNATGLMKLEDVVETFLDETDGTGVLDETKTYGDVVQKYGPMNTWDVSRVTDMHWLFEHKKAFNAYIGDWDVSQVTSMSGMFHGARVFNNGAAGGEPGPPLKWNTSKVNNMIGMFERATAFNADIGGWNTSGARYMGGMFRGASAFNQDIRRWNVSNVKNFIRMFNGASEFNQNLSDWNQPDKGKTVDPTANKTDMFLGSGVTQENRPSWLLPSLAEATFGAPTGASDGPPAANKRARADAPGLLDQLPPELLHRVTTFVGDDPCKEKWDNICATDKRLANICRDDQFWKDLCEREGWDRDDRTTGWHAMPDPPTKTQWKDQFFKWCKLRFGPLSQAKLAEMFSGGYQKYTSLHQNESGYAMLMEAVDQFLANTNGTGVLDKPREYYSSEDGGVSIVQKYGPMNTWDVSRVTDMSFLFMNKDAFNAYIGLWDVSRVMDMSYMFKGATAFNNGAAGGEPGNPLEWVTSEVRRMAGMFRGATAFNADIGGWNVSNVRQMELMFQNASAFNADIGRWNVSKVDDFILMFESASAFDQNLEGWNQPKEGRKVKKDATKNAMFANSGLIKRRARYTMPSWIY